MISFLSGEFVLNKRANGGTAVTLRALWVAALGYVGAVFLRETLDPKSTLAFSGEQLRQALVDNLPVAGAIFAAAYAALYARFASQWTYLAGVYNQIMAAKVRGIPTDDAARRALEAWEAGFLEDAEDLHLATKPMFASVIIGMLERQAVRDKFILGTAGGSERLEVLERDVKEAFARADERQKSRAKKRLREKPPAA